MLDHHEHEKSGPSSPEHLDLVTAELRRRIAGIGLAIAELREETGRLRSSADDRYHAVAVLDRPPSVDDGPSNAHGAVSETSAPAVISAELTAPSEPAPPWHAAAAAGEPVGALTWIPGPEVVPAPAITAEPSVVAPPVPAVPTPAPRAVGEVWPELDEVDEAAFEAFFSAEVDPEPAQRWLLSDS